MARAFTQFGGGTALSDRIETSYSSQHPQWTFACRFNYQSVTTPNTARIFDKRSNNTGDLTPAMVLSFDESNNNLRLERAFSTSGSSNFSIGAIPRQIWHGVVITCTDSTLLTVPPTFYLNGNLATSTRSGSPVGSPRSNPQAYRIGNRLSNDRPFRGYLAEIAFWEGIIPADYAKEISKNASPKIYPNGLRFYLDLVRDVFEQCGTGATSQTGTNVVNHPPIFYPDRGGAISPAAAFSGVTLSASGMASAGSIARGSSGQEQKSFTTSTLTEVATGQATAVLSSSGRVQSAQLIRAQSNAGETVFSSQSILSQGAWIGGQASSIVQGRSLLIEAEKNLARPTTLATSSGLAQFAQVITARSTAGETVFSTQSMVTQAAWVGGRATVIEQSRSGLRQLMVIRALPLSLISSKSKALISYLLPNKSLQFLGASGDIRYQLGTIGRSIGVQVGTGGAQVGTGGTGRSSSVLMGRGLIRVGELANGRSGLILASHAIALARIEAFALFRLPIRAFTSSPFASFANAVLIFDQSEFVLDALLTEGDRDISALSSNDLPAPREVYFYLEGRAVNPMLLPPEIGYRARADCVWDGRDGRFVLGWIVRSPWGDTEVLGTKITGYWQPS